MRYCERCVLPDSRPGLEIDDSGICNACQGHQLKETEIDWDARRSAFDTLVKETKARGAQYDCIVPVSGGKDSTYQVVKCLEHGLKTLAISWRSPGRNAIGQKNLDNLISLGVDHIDFSVSPRVESVFTRKSFIQTGSTAVPMHMGIYVIPLSFAVSMNIPLVVWGESPYMEYGASGDNPELRQLSHSFLKTHGILQGTLADDWIDDELTAADLAAFQVPSEEEFTKAKIESIFIGYYFPWSPQVTLQVASENGFQVREEGPKVGYYNYADIDCDFISVHHYLKWYKFGFTRLFDNLSLEIRNGHLSRDEAIQIIKERGDQKPTEDIKSACAFMDISEEKFWEVCESFRNTDIWSQKGGKWQIDDFLIPDWDWGA